MKTGKPQFSSIKIDEDEDINLDNLINEQSWLIFDLLECYDILDYEWMTEDACSWSMSDGYNKFANYMKNVHVVNDLAERGIKLISDFIDKSQDEEQIQALLHVVKWH